MGRTRGTDARWKARKTENRFPALSTALGNRWCDSHIPTGSATNLPSCGLPNGTLAPCGRSQGKALLGWVGLGYKYGSPIAAPMAGFGVTAEGVGANATLEA